MFHKFTGVEQKLLPCEIWPELLKPIWNNYFGSAFITSSGAKTIQDFNLQLVTGLLPSGIFQVCHKNGSRLETDQRAFQNG
ncbi:hypothetical protein T10_1418 [Trichinella papuae]|uniref:Uncharacterized protein n=1 Tax=Trichinella papuae TaxID=268474 RepID=A0A0V1ME15_9BILA|nr:hypothetical protein T10_1418 [Trichinella papuae]